MWSSLRGRCGCSWEHLEGRLLLLRLLTALGFQFPWEPARALNSFSALIRSVSCFQYQGVYGLSAKLTGSLAFLIFHNVKLKGKSGLCYKSNIKDKKSPKQAAKQLYWNWIESQREFTGRHMSQRVREGERAIPGGLKATTVVIFGAEQALPTRRMEQLTKDDRYHVSAATEGSHAYHQRGF